MYFEIKWMKTKFDLARGNIYSIFILVVLY